MSSVSRLLRVGEAAEILGLDGREVYEAIDAGELPAHHVEGHGVRLRREACGLTLFGTFLEGPAAPKVLSVLRWSEEPLLL